MDPQDRPYPVVVIIDFHHARGPEVEHWIGVRSPDDVSEWPLLPFLALADGAHSSEEDFSYFTLKHKETSLFGIACTRQLDSRQLIERSAEVTRSTVQKAVVVIADSPVYFFGHLKQQLSAVTQAWFAQRNFEDLEIIRHFQESLKVSLDNGTEREQYVGLSLREIIYEFKWQALVLFKCMLLQPKMLFFSQRCERLCMVQFSLLSLIPGLLRNLQDCSDPELDTYERTLVKPTSVKTSDKKSLLTFMGLPLQLFGRGSLFGPYTPLQHLDILADVGTKSYMVGSTNSLLLQQRDRYSDILINLDEKTVNITSSSLRSALNLSAADRRWIDYLTQSVVDSWDDADPSRPKTMGFIGSEDYIRMQFEEYILSLISAVKYHHFLEKHTGSDMNVFLPDIEGDPSGDFNSEFIDYWEETENFRIFQKFTDPELFDLVSPRHVMAGGLSMDDVQRRIAQQVQELHLDEKVNASREAAARALAAGRNNLTLAFTNISKNVERLREQRRQDQENQQPAVDSTPTSPILAEASNRAGAYLSSWATWAGEKKKRFTAPPTPNTESVTEGEASTTPKPSIFSRWSKSSADIPGAADVTRGMTSSEIEVRETVWDGGEKELPNLPPKSDTPEEKAKKEALVEAELARDLGLPSPLPPMPISKDEPPAKVDERAPTPPQKSDPKPEPKSEAVPEPAKREPSPPAVETMPEPPAPVPAPAPALAAPAPVPAPVPAPAPARAPSPEPVPKAEAVPKPATPQSRPSTADSAAPSSSTTSSGPASPPRPSSRRTSTLTSEATSTPLARKRGSFPIKVNPSSGPSSPSKKDGPPPKPAGSLAARRAMFEKK